MQRLIDFLAMGGYAGFVWPAYAVAAIVLIGLLWQSLHLYRCRSRELDLFRGASGRRGRGTPGGGGGAA